MKKPTVEELAAFIAKNISYDATEHGEAVKCPHCGKMAREPSYSYWIDHRSVLAGEIARFLGLKVYEQVDDILELQWVDGKKNEDAPRLAEEIIKGIYAE